MTNARAIRSWVLGGSAIALLLGAGTAEATVTFGRTDVRTVFHIAKSDDHNRVDYGLHLDRRCQPVGNSPLYAYWHRFEPGEPRFGDLNMMDASIYGITDQAVRSRSESGTWIDMHVAAMPDLRILVLAQRHGDGCIARAQIPVNDRPAFVDRVFVQLSTGIFAGIEHVTFSGVDTQTQQHVSERRRR